MIADIFTYLAGDKDWIAAPLECRKGFTIAMRNRIYGRDQTLTAWHWFYMGWTGKEVAPPWTFL